jgi:hypothetical protein
MNLPYTPTTHLLLSPPHTPSWCDTKKRSNDTHRDTNSRGKDVYTSGIEGKSMAKIKLQADGNHNWSPKLSSTYFEI